MANSKSFITNNKVLLSGVMNDILPTTKELDFLVGFFYFSGFQEVCDAIGKKKARVLIGMDIERGLGGVVNEVSAVTDGKKMLSRLQQKENFYNALVEVFNNSEYFDSEAHQNMFRFFVDKILDGTLAIKKTKEPNHAKLYIFTKKRESSEGGRYPGTVIVGSSNLSRSGMSGQREVNVILREPHVYQEAVELFNELWDSAIHIVSRDDKNDFKEKVLTKIWLDQLPSPHLLYLRVLAEYFAVADNKEAKLPAEITDEKFINLQYQTDAIKQALEIIDRHNGVIVADVVGLGKSIIASAVAYNLRMKTIIIAPPHLKEQWDNYRYQFDFTAKVYGSGSIKKALDENDEEPKLIIVDEAHKYRNEETGYYKELHKLCHAKRNKVVLLSATPFNNRPQDIFSQIKLFQIPGRSTIRTIDNLSFSFRGLVKEYQAIQKDRLAKTISQNKLKARVDKLAVEIRDLVAPLMIRRSRLDIDKIDVYREDVRRQGISFPVVELPKALDYELGELSGLYQWTLQQIYSDSDGSGFIGARYKPATYLKDIQKYKKRLTAEFGDVNMFKQAQVNLAKFMRRLLVRRFESSVDAFLKTLDAIIASSENIKNWHDKLGQVPIYKKGQVPNAGDLIDSRLSGDEAQEELENIDFDQELRREKAKGLELVPTGEIKKKFITDLNHDIDLLKEIRRRWTQERPNGEDPKMDHFRDLIKKQLADDPQRKIVVFSEFADTVDYLYGNLKDELKVYKYHSGVASAERKKVIGENFDASSSRLSNDYNVLIATDAISEGFNLNQAGTVFNYDIPYNPMRVTQRVGRINRVNKKVFDKLFIYNFFPSDTGERETRTKEISTLKLAMHNALLGEDTKILTSEEELRSFYADQYNEALKTQEQTSWDADYINLIENIRSSDREMLDKVMAVPKRVRIRRGVKKSKSGVIVFGKKGEEYTFKLGTSSNEYVNLSPAAAIDIFTADKNEKAKQVSQKFELIYQNVRKNLFGSRQALALDKGRQEALNKISALEAQAPDKYHDYLQDVGSVIRELDSLPQGFLRQIRAINEKTLEEDLKTLFEEMPPDYIRQLKEQAQAVEEGEESLILSEELK